jgi:hypothetical protein
MVELMYIPWGSPNLQHRFRKGVCGYDASLAFFVSKQLN